MQAASREHFLIYTFIQVRWWPLTKKVCALISVATINLTLSRQGKALYDTNTLSACSYYSSHEHAIVKANHTSLEISVR